MEIFLGIVFIIIAIVVIRFIFKHKSFFIGLAVIVGVIYLIVTGISSWRENQIKIAREDGRKAGYEAGYEEVAKTYRPKVASQKSTYEKKIKSQQANYGKQLETQKNSFENQLTELKINYEKKNSQAEVDGLSTGKKDKLASTDETIEKKANENKVKGKWDTVLFEAKK